MAERKVLNKYYPPDFDPSKLRRFEKKSVRKMCNVRMMLPMSVRCHTCGNYAYIGTKFNMKVETVKDEDYLGIKIYRFYFKCTQCYSEITFRTDPKNHDYIAEWGASRNHEPWKDMLMAEEEYKEMKQNEMKEDAMKSLEHRTYDSKREMDILDALDQVKSLNRRQAQVNFEDLIGQVIHKEQEKEDKEMERDIEEEAHRIYERMKIRRIRDYSEIKLNEEDGEQDAKEFKNSESFNVISNENDDVNNSLAGGKSDSHVFASNESRSGVGANFSFKAGKGFSYDSDEDKFVENAGLFRKGNFKNFSNSNGDNKNNKALSENNGSVIVINANGNNVDFLNKKRGFENEENSVFQDNSKNGQSVFEKENENANANANNGIHNKNDFENEEENENKINKNKSIFDKFANKDDNNDENSSDSSDSIEKDFEKNQEIFNFSGPNTKLKISKNTNNKNVNLKSNLNNNIVNKPNPSLKPINFLNPIPFAKSKINPISKNAPPSNQKNIVANKPKITGLSSLISNYSTDDLSE